MKTIEEQFLRLWQTVILNNQIELSEEIFLDIMTQRYETNKTAFIEMIREYISTVWKVVDINGDCFISEEEFMNDVVSTGHIDTKKYNALFFSFKPTNGRVPMTKLTEEYIRFATENLESKRYFFKNALDFGV
jgi:hypothetical protein